jgi:hypothetical protein
MFTYIFTRLHTFTYAGKDGLSAQSYDEQQGKNIHVSRYVYKYIYIYIDYLTTNNKERISE